MRTILKIPFTRESTIPQMHAYEHDLPGFPHVMCIDVMNRGNVHVPANLLHAMLVPEGTVTPKLGNDRTVYPVPTDFEKVDVLLTVGIINDVDHVVLHMNIRLADGSTMTHNHVACPLL